MPSALRPHTLAVTATLALAAVSAASAQTADEVVAKNIVARGGAEKLKAINSAKITGKVAAQGREMAITTWSKRPNFTRREVVVQGQTMVSGFDGTTGWMLNPMMGAQAQEISGPPAEMIREDAEFDPAFLDYKQKGHTIELVGNETIDSRAVHHLKITKKNGRIQHHYIDAKDGLEVRMVLTVDQEGKKAEVTTDFSDHRSVDGITVPFSMRQTLNGAPGAQVTIEKIEFNVPVEDSIFAMPK